VIQIKTIHLPLKVVVDTTKSSSSDYTPGWLYSASTEILGSITIQYLTRLHKPHHTTLNVMASQYRMARRNQRQPNRSEAGILLAHAEPIIISSPLPPHVALRHPRLDDIRESARETYFSNTTPNTSSTSPASPLPVIRAKQSAAARSSSAARTTSRWETRFADSTSVAGADVSETMSK
jgi:hypothetical protein